MVGNLKCKHCNSPNIIRWGGKGTTQTWKCKNCNRYSNIGKKRPKKEVKLEYNYSLGYIIGVILGDGSMGKSKDYWYFNEKNQQVPKSKATRIITRYRYLFQLQVIDKDFVEEYVKHIQTLMGKKPKPYITKRKPVTEIAGNILKKPYAPTFYKVQFSSKEWYHKLKPLTDNLEWLKTTGKEVKKGFLRGIFDSDGGAHEEKYRVSIHLTNKKLKIIEITHHLLKDFGIKSSVYYYKDGMIRVCLNNNKAIKLFFDKIGFAIKRKQKKGDFYKRN